MKSNLHKKTITNKAGKKQVVWVKNGEEVKSPKGKKAEDAPKEKNPKAEETGGKDMKHFEDLAKNS